MNPHALVQNNTPSPRTSTKNKSVGLTLEQLIALYGCGDVKLAGTDNALQMTFTAMRAIQRAFRV